MIFIWQIVVQRLKVAQLAKSDRQFCHSTKLRDKVAQLCCMSDMGLTVLCVKML